MSEKPVSEKPVFEKPATEKPSTKKPASEKPVSEKPAFEKLKPIKTCIWKTALCWHSPFALNTSTEKPLTEKPVCEKPVTEKPVTEKRVSEKPVSEVFNSCIYSKGLQQLSKDQINMIIYVVTFNFPKIESKNDPWNCPWDWLISSHGCRDTWDYLFNDPGYHTWVRGYPTAGSILLLLVESKHV